MQKLKCELCGSIDILKVEEDLFQCQNCGCKYSAAEVKKILFGEVTFKSQDYEIVGGKLVKYNGSATAVDIPDSVSVIGCDAFSGCSGITSVRIPESVSIIESGAFSNCISLREAVIPGSIRSFGESVFSGCTGLCSVTVKNGITYIPQGTFFNCSSLSEIVIPDSVREIRRGAFTGCSRLSEVNLPCGLVSIGDEAFKSCRSIRSVSLPGSVTAVGERAFAGCEALMELCLPQSVSVRASSFEGARSLMNVTGNAAAYLDSIKGRYGIDEIGRMNPFCETYVNELKSLRRKKKVCEYCGGAFYGVIHKYCEKCGRIKSY